MAHKNIEERRSWLRGKLDQSKNLTLELTEEALTLFGCSAGAIYSDWQAINIERHGRMVVTTTIRTTVTRKLKIFLKLRDGNICQYCEKDAGENSIMEHIIPAAWGGIAEPRNMVVACRSCNALKGRRVWVPHNFYEITANEPAWRRMVINLQRKGKEFNGRRKINHPEKVGA